MPDSSRADLLRGARILVADDSGLAAALTAAALREAGCRVEIVEDGLDALDALERRTFDLLVTDRVMPRLDGLELCRAIRAREGGASLYVLLLSASADKGKVVEGLAAGADDYLAKPFDPAELLARVRAGLRIVGLQRELVAANRTLSRLALCDPLTELPNRRAVFELLNHEAARQDRWAEDTCVAMVDLDRFKPINDRHGHAAGDRVLVAVAAALRQAARAGDLVGRIGGEEFVVILHGADLAQAADACERLRAAVAALRIPGSEVGGLAVTASFGVARLCPGEKAGDVLEAADRALYRAKEQGRNRVVCAEEPEPVGAPLAPWAAAA